MQTLTHIFCMLGRKHLCTYCIQKMMHSLVLQACQQKRGIAIRVVHRQKYDLEDSHGHIYSAAVAHRDGSFHLCFDHSILLDMQDIDQNIAANMHFMYKPSFFVCNKYE